MLCKYRALVSIERGQNGYSHPNICQSWWIKIKFLKWLFWRENSLLLYRSQWTLYRQNGQILPIPPLLSEVVWFALGLDCGGGGRMPFFSILHWSFSTTSPHRSPLPTTNCPLVNSAFDGLTSALFLYPIPPLVNSSELLHHNVLLYVPSW